MLNTNLNHTPKLEINSHIAYLDVLQVIKVEFSVRLESNHKYQLNQMRWRKFLPMLITPSPTNTQL